MDADLDTLCTVIYCTADDLLPEARANARRRVTDAELVTLCVAQAIMGIPSDRRFLRAARRQLGHLFPQLPSQPAYWQAPAPPRRRDRVAHGRVREPEPGLSRRTAARRLDPGASAPAAVRRPSARPSQSAAGYGYCAAHSRCSGAFACTCWPRPTARRGRSSSPIRGATSARSRSSCSRARARGGEVLVCDKGYAGREFAAAAAELGVTSRARRAGMNPARACTWLPIRQRIESIFWTCKDLLTLERHGARTLAGLRERILQRFLCLAACISLNHRLGRPSRALVDYCA